jgi:hypothetical protein
MRSHVGFCAAAISATNSSARTSTCSSDACSSCEKWNGKTIRTSAAQAATSGSAPEQPHEQVHRQSRESEARKRREVVRGDLADQM